MFIVFVKILKRVDLSYDIKAKVRFLKELANLVREKTNLENLGKLCAPIVSLISIADGPFGKKGEEYM